jgi:hypothetical protein
MGRDPPPGHPFHLSSQENEMSRVTCRLLGGTGVAQRQLRAIDKRCALVRAPEGTQAPWRTAESRVAAARAIDNEGWIDALRHSLKFAALSTLSAARRLLRRMRAELAQRQSTRAAAR